MVYVALKLRARTCGRLSVGSRSKDALSFQGTQPAHGSNSSRATMASCRDEPFVVAIELRHSPYVHLAFFRWLVVRRVGCLRKRKGMRLPLVRRAAGLSAASSVRGSWSNWFGTAELRRRSTDGSTIPTSRSGSLACS